MAGWYNVWEMYCNSYITFGADSSNRQNEVENVQYIYLFSLFMDEFSEMYCMLSSKNAYSTKFRKNRMYEIQLRCYAQLSYIQLRFYAQLSYIQLMH